MTTFQPPQIKKKKGVNHQQIPLAFPLEKIQGVFNGLSVEILDKTNIKNYSDCYGTIGNKTNHKAQEFCVKNALHRKAAENTTSLSLGLEESFFLAHFTQKLEIVDLQNVPISDADFFSHALKIEPLFVECTVAYLYLKSKGWVIKSGIKFGGDFLIYKKGPRYNHGSYIVIVVPTTADVTVHYSAIDIQGLQRLAETADKGILRLEVTKPKDNCDMEDIKSCLVTETIIQRFNYNNFVQKQQQSNKSNKKNKT